MALAPKRLGLFLFWKVCAHLQLISCHRAKFGGNRNSKSKNLLCYKKNLQNIFDPILDFLSQKHC